MESSKKPKILFLSAWYPNRYDAMAGLFVRKHAEAVSRYANVCVLYLHLDSRVVDFQIVEQDCGEIKEFIVYIPLNKNKISTGISFFKGFFKGYREVNKYFGKPDITQVNTLTRNGIIAYFLKLTQRIPYFIIEHWTRYLPENFNYKGFLRRKATELVAQNAIKIMPVSNMLRTAMQKQNIKGNYGVISNVVDDCFYTIPRVKNIVGKKRILHVSCFLDRQKNISGILKAIKILSFSRSDFELVIVGTGVDFDQIKKLAQSLDIPPNMLIFTGEQTPDEVAKWFSESDLFVMFSNFETACVVVMESLASGVPLIATPTGIVPDFINPNNGCVVDFEDVDGLADKINFMLDNINQYNSLEIREQAKVFRSDYVGQKLFNEYIAVFEKKQI